MVVNYCHIFCADDQSELSLTLSVFVCLCLSLSLSRSVCVCVCVCVSLFLSLPLSLTHTHVRMQAHSHPYTRTHWHTLTLPLCVCVSLSLFLSHTRMHAHSHTYIHSPYLAHPITKTLGHCGWLVQVCCPLWGCRVEAVHSLVLPSRCFFCLLHFLPLCREVCTRHGIVGMCPHQVIFFVLTMVVWRLSTCSLRKVVSSEKDGLQISVLYMAVLLFLPPRWPSGWGVHFESWRSGVQIPLAMGFFRVESYQRLKHWHSSGYPARRLVL